MTISAPLEFPHTWKAQHLYARPLILPPRHFVYPVEVEDVERGALEVLVTPEEGQPFLATFALGFRDPAAPTGLWAAPHPDWLCAVAGGYAYLVNTRSPETFVQVAYRPVLDVRALPEKTLLLFLGHYAIQAWGSEGLAWESERLSDEGVELLSIAGERLHGSGWNMRTDREVPFVLDLLSGKKLSVDSG